MTALGFDCQPGKSASEIKVTAPYWRSDIGLPVDLIEEVTRIIGYDQIPTTLLSQPIPRHNPEPIIGLKREVRQYLGGYGFQEIITFSLTSLEVLNKLSPEPHPPVPAPLRVANPMTAEQEYLRPNLRAGLLAALAANRRHEDGGIRLYELGRVYLPRANDLPDEREVLCGLLSGAKVEKSWLGDDEVLDFFAAKGAVEGLLTQLGVTASFELGSDESFQATTQAAIVLGDSRVGIIGEVHTRVLESFEITGGVYLFEIDLAALLPFTLGHKRFQPIPRFPAIVRDMALVIDAGIAHQPVVDTIKSFPLVGQVNIFDVYSGEQVPPGKKSLAYRIAFQSPTHTLTDSEVDQVQQQILTKLSGDLGATLRG